MIVDELVSILSKCQVIYSGVGLYKILVNCSELEYIEESLNKIGYSLAYNKKDDCFVVY